MIKNFTIKGWPYNYRVILSAEDLAAVGNNPKVQKILERPFEYVNDALSVCEDIFPNAKANIIRTTPNS